MEEGKTIADVLAPLGWKPLPPAPADTRRVHELQAAEKLKRQAKGVEEDELEKNLLTRAVEVSKAPEHAEARSLIASEDPELLARMDTVEGKLQDTRKRRQRKLDRLGVFDAATNELRAKSMMRVELYRKLGNRGNLRRDEGQRVQKKVDSDELSLEDRLLNLIDDLDALDPQEPEETEEDMARQLAAAAANAAAQARRNVTLPPEVEEMRRLETEQAVEQMVMRYRGKVEEKRTAIL